jgi:uncharacterized protein (TIGR01244 family)
MPSTLQQLNLPYQRQLGDLITCGQLEVSQLQQLADAGIKTLIFNRPDAEEVGQPAVVALAVEAQRLGMAWVFQPVISGQVSRVEGAEFGRLYAQAAKPAVAFCRTGARCGCLWALSQVDTVQPSELVAQMRAAGFDMPDFFQQLLSYK